MVDLAAMRNAMARLGGNPEKINPLVPADLVVDHSVQVDYARDPDALAKNLNKEMERNAERFQFLKWSVETPQTQSEQAHVVRSIRVPLVPRSILLRCCSSPILTCVSVCVFRGSQSFSNFLIVPPGSGIVHQVRRPNTHTNPPRAAPRFASVWFCA